MQFAMNRHLSQSVGAGALVGQHGMSLAISSAITDMDMSVIADIDASEAVPAMTGRDSGANTSPAIMKIASIRRMVIWLFTPQNPTYPKKLEASQANDAVMRCAPAKPDSGRNGRNQGHLRIPDRQVADSRMIPVPLSGRLIGKLLQC